MVKRSQHSRVIAVFGKGQGRVAGDFRYQIPADRKIHPFPQKIFLCHNTSAKHDDLWIKDTAYIGNALS